MSLVEALAASVPPCASTTFEFKMPRGRVGQDVGQAGVGRARRHDDGLGAVGGDRLAGEQERRVALQVDEPVSDQTTSAEVTGVPSENLAFGLRWKMYFRAPSSAWYDVARSRHDLLEVATVEGDQRVVEGVDDQLAGRLEHVTGVGGDENERVIDYEGAPRGARCRCRHGGHGAQQESCRR